MTKTYNPQKIEKKWQKHWEEQELYRAKDTSDKPKEYILVEFPYPSGAGLHVGHVRSYTALDVLARKHRMEGKNVLYPIGWDAFGLPTENYAIKHKIHPRQATQENVATFKRQLQSLGLSYDWSREINTTDPEYYKWTQWIFLKLFEKGLAYKKKMPINWCPSCKIGLANEEVIDGKCERCGAATEQKEKEQWMLAITKYADRLIDDLDTVDYLEKIKVQQKNWIGRSEGAKVTFKLKVENSELKERIHVFTTRIDTIFSGTYIVLAPEHTLINDLKSEISNWDQVEEYIVKARKKTDLQRTDLAKEKEGVELKGIKAVNPATNEEIPVWIADFVLAHYGTGAVFADAHDERDWEFAKKYDIRLKESIAPYIRIEGMNAPRSDKDVHKFHAVTAVIRHWSEEKYLFVRFDKGLWGLIGGSVEESDNHYDEAILREAEEETVFKNFGIVGKIFNQAYSRGYKTRKSREEECNEIVYVLQATDDMRSDDIAELEGIKEWAWLTAEEALKKNLLTHHQFYFEHFLRENRAFTDDGVLMNSGQFDGLTSEEARPKIIEWLAEKGLAEKTVKYKLRDWVFSRQHYWGEPIPIVHCEQCGTVLVPEDQLPVELPDVKSYEPTDTGESPLAQMTEWVNVACPKCGGAARRETDTMPNWAGSSWYFLRYIDPSNNNALADPEKLTHWMPVDLYNGGMEHTTLHLLYSRFWNKFLYDIGVSPVSEPYARRRSHGMILANDGKKMSKSLGNVINPDDVVKEFGADALRLYEMFMGPFGETIPWSTEGVSGVRRFLDKVWRLQTRIAEHESQNVRKEIKSLLHKTIKKVTEDIENFRFNTAISAMMVFVNSCEKVEKIDQDMYEKFLTILSPFAPHISEELWEKLEYKESIFLQEWPKYDEVLIQDEMITLVVQVNGKVRDKLEVSADILEEEAREKALASEKVQKFIEGKEIRKVIFVKGRLVNIVI